MSKILALLICSFFLVSCEDQTTIYTQNSKSMEPSVKAGSSVKIEPLKEDLDRFDVIVFKRSSNDQNQYLSRIIGLPNEKVSIPVDELLIDGKSLFGHVKLPSRGMKEYKLIHEEYFVIGDSFKESLDSRSYGPIKKEWIIGKVNIEDNPWGKINPHGQIPDSN